MVVVAGGTQGEGGQHWGPSLEQPGQVGDIAHLYLIIGHLRVPSGGCSSSLYVGCLAVSPWSSAQHLLPFLVIYG